MSSSDVPMSGHRTEARSELREQAARVREDVSELARLARAAAREEFDRLRSGAQHSVGTGREKAERLQQRLDAKVAERPLTSLAMALGTGFVLGLFMSRSGRGER